LNGLTPCPSPRGEGSELLKKIILKEKVVVK
jgi:hypothetical protein